MRGKEAAGRLLAAQEIVREVYQELNDEKVKCGACKIDRYRCWPAHLMHEQLHDLALKLEKMAVILQDHRSFNETPPPCPSCHGTRFWQAQDRVMCFTCGLEEKV